MTPLIEGINQIENPKDPPSSKASGHISNGDEILKGIFFVVHDKNGGKESSLIDLNWIE